MGTRLREHGDGDVVEQPTVDGVVDTAGDADDLSESVGLDETLAQTLAHDAVADDGDACGGHRSGSSSGRQPPRWGGVPPEPPRRMAAAANTVAVSAARTRRMNFTATHRPPSDGGATWNRTRDLIVISDAL